MSDDTLANIFLGIALISLAGITAAAFLYPSWWILGPLMAVLVVDFLWAMAEAG